MKRKPASPISDAPAADASDVPSTLNRLERTIRYSDSLTLAFAKCNSPVQRREMSAALRDRLQDLRVLEVELEEPIVSLLDVLMERWNAAEPPQDVFVYGLEKSIGEAREFSPVFLRLNHDRDLLRRSIPAPLLIWLPDFALDCMVRGAPDFWAWRSGVYEFPTRREHWQRDVTDWSSREDFTLISLDLQEKRSEIARLESLLRSAEELPRRGRRARQIEAALAYQLGVLYESMGELGHAHETFTKALHLYERLGEVRERAILMGRIADILRVRGNFNEALRIHREEQLPVFERLDDVRERAVTMGRIADILRALGDSEGALRILVEEELPVYERLGDVHARAITMGRIADILQARGNLDEALRIRREEELPVYERIGNLRERAITMGKVADILEARGDLNEALRIRREEELPVYERLGDVLGRAITMGKVANILDARGDLDEALRIRREEQIPVYERLGAVKELLVGQANLAINLLYRDAPGDREEASRLLGQALEAAHRLRLPDADRIEAILKKAEER